MPTHRVRLPGSLTGRRPPVDRGYVHFCAEVCVHVDPIERVILECLTRGLSNKEIAAAGAIEPKTVRNRLSRLYTRLGVSDRLQLALLAVDSGLCGRVHV